jgi:O-antigen/teichoic acid export membrane protein
MAANKPSKNSFFKISKYNKNVTFNYLGTAASVAGPLIALPWYLSILGTQNFGLVGFIITLQGILLLLESGLSQVSYREFAVKLGKFKSDLPAAANLLSGFEKIYWSLSLGAAILLIFLSGVIAEYWIVLDEKSLSLGKQAVYGAAIIFIFQFPGGLYKGFLQAAEEQVTLNTILISCIILRHLFGVLILFNWPSLLTYIVWQISTIALETILRSFYSWKFLKTIRTFVIFNYTAFRPALISAIKMSLVVLLGVLTTQLDRIILSGMVPIEQYGFYVVASSVSLGVLGLIHPFVIATAPGMMQSHDNNKKMHELNLRLIKIIATIVFTGVVLFIIGGEWFLKVWIRDVEAVSIIYPLLSILLIGSALNAFYHVGYYNWLAKHRSDRILLVNSVGLVLTLIVTPILIKSEGMIGATFGFVAMNFISLVLSLEWIRKHSGSKNA